MKIRLMACILFLVVVIAFYSLSCATSGGGGGGDDDTADDDGAAGGGFCSSFCNKMFECFGETVMEESGYSSAAECAADCEEYNGSEDPEADCVDSCGWSSSCGDWIDCTNGCF